MECLNLISRNSFVEKRIGYLGITHLFSEKSDILMMATHRIGMDLESSNHYIQANALQTFSSIADDDMCKGLGDTIAGLIGKGHSYISKKACLAGVRVISRVPEMADTFIQRLDKVLVEKNHGLLLSALALSRAIMKVDPEKKTYFKKHLNHLVSFFF